MLQDSRLQSIFEVLKVIPREFGIDPLVHELELDEGKKTLISLRRGVLDSSNMDSHHFSNAFHVARIL